MRVFTGRKSGVHAPQSIRQSKIENPMTLQFTYWYLQQRRKRRAAAHVQIPAFPEVSLTDGSFEGESTWFNTSFAITVDLKTWPGASLEIWVNANFSGYALLDTV